MPANPNDIYLIGEIASEAFKRLDRIATAQETANRINLLRLEQSVATSRQLGDPQFAHEIAAIRRTLDN